MADNNKTTAALTGMVLATAATWARYDDDTQRRIRNARLDASDALDWVRALSSSGQLLRLRIPVVQDAIAGLGIASKTETSPALLPGTTPYTRPDLASTIRGLIADMKWPPEGGIYDDRGMVKEVGELTAPFLALTYEEDRAWILGLVQSTPPTTEAKLQIYYAAHALAAVVSQLSLTEPAYEAAWLRLFGGSLSTVNHSDVAKPPTLLSKDNGITSIQPRGLPEIVNYATPHNNTDQASKWRITVGGANVNAGTTIATFQFGSQYRNAAGVAIEPAVTTSDGRFRIVNVSSTQFSIINVQQLALGDVVDVAFVAVQ